MAGRIKHAKRSSKTATNNYNTFSKFAMNAQGRKKKVDSRRSMVDMVKALFKMRTTNK